VVLTPISFVRCSFGSRYRAAQEAARQTVALPYAKISELWPPTFLVIRFQDNPSDSRGDFMRTLSYHHSELLNLGCATK
jgi:hypothetical protein